MYFLGFFKAINKLFFEHLNCVVNFFSQQFNFLFLFFLLFLVFLLKFKILFVLKGNLFLIHGLNFLHHFFIFLLCVCEVALEKRLKLFLLLFKFLEFGRKFIDNLLFLLWKSFDLLCIFFVIIIILKGKFPFHFLKIFFKQFCVSDFFINIVSLNQDNFSQIFIHNTNHGIELILCRLIMWPFVSRYESLSISEGNLINKYESIFACSENIPTARAGQDGCDLLHVVVQGLLDDVVELGIEYF